ncbi:MAG: hypothetical protein U0R78_15510 [Nocardioidaceae bacterium]
MSFMDAAPSVYACFDQPDLKAPFTFHVRAPQDWTVFGNTRGTQVEPGEWEFETSQPLSTYFTTLVAGLRPRHRRARRDPTRRLGTRQHRPPTRGRRRRHPHGHQAEHRRGSTACSGSATSSATTTRHSCRSSTPARWRSPGCITFRDTLIFTSRVTRSGNRATTIAHEMAHQVVRQPHHPGVVGRPVAQRVVRRVPRGRVTADATQYADAWRTTAMPAGSGGWSPAGRKHPSGGRQRGRRGCVDGAPRASTASPI